MPWTIANVLCSLDQDFSEKQHAGQVTRAPGQAGWQSRLRSRC